MKINSILKIFQEIDNNLKNDMIRDRIKLYNKSFNYNNFVNAIKKYIDNFSVLKETNDDELLHMIHERANNILLYTKNKFFDVHAFTNDAVYLMDKAPSAPKNKSKKSSFLLEDVFYNFLLKNGYPKDKIIKEGKLTNISTNRLVFDIVILDENNNNLAYIEIKSSISKTKSGETIRQLRNKQVGNMLFYVVIFIQEEQQFIYAKINEDKVIYLDEFPTYQNLINNSKSTQTITKSLWNDFVSSVKIEKLKKIKKNIKDINYEEGENVRGFLKKFALHLQEKIPRLKSYKWKLNQASTQTQWSDENGFRLSFYKGKSLPDSTQINITFWASWHGGVFIKDNENIIFSKPKLIEDLQKKYPNIEFQKTKKHIMAIHFKNGMPTEDQVINAIKQLVDILENSQVLNNTTTGDKKSIESGTSIAIPSEIAIKKKSAMKSVLGVEAVANTLSSVIIKGFDDTGMMIGIFGKWGRGKTHFLEKLWESIKEKRIGYKRVLFLAWKYQDTKASWAYLYENIFNVYISDRENEHTWIRKVRDWFENKTWHKVLDKIDNFYIENKKIFYINIQKHSWTPIIIFCLLFMIAAIWSFWIDKWEIAHYIISTVGIVLAIKLIIFYFAQKSSAIDLYKKYFFKNNFGDYLGLQSEIENELIVLLKTWIPNPNDDEKIVLFVDDIDRCNIEQVIDIIDGLRVILDNPEIHSRLIIVTAIDETILQQALVHKYKDIDDNDMASLNSMYKEYLEKIFIIGLKLNILNNNEMEEILLTILPDIDEIIEDNSESNRNEDIINTPSTDDDHTIEESIGTEKIAIDESVITVIETNNNKKDDEIAEINIHEKRYLLEAIKKLDNVTPRKIRIFYYKYLMMKILFDIRIKEKSLIVCWDSEKNEKIIIDLLIHLANGNKSSDFDFNGNSEILEELLYVGEMVSVL